MALEYDVKITGMISGQGAALLLLCNNSARFVQTLWRCRQAA